MQLSRLFRSSGNAVRKSKPPAPGRKIVAGKGQGCLGNGTESVKGVVQAKIVKALCLGERSMASRMLLDIGHGNRIPSADDFVDILRYCSRSPDPLFVMETWKTMEVKKVSMNNKCYLLIIQALCKGGFLEEAFGLMSSLGEHPVIHPLLAMCNDFLGACVQMHSVYHASKCLDLMEKKMLGKNEETYEQLLELAVLQKNLSAVHNIWKECTKYYNPSILLLKNFIGSFARLRDLNSAYVVLQHMLPLALQGGSILTETAEGKRSTRRLDIPIPSKNDLYLEKHSEGNEISMVPAVGHCRNVDAQSSDNRHCSTFGIETGEYRNIGMDMLKKNLSDPIVRILRWSFNYVMYACAQTKNSALAENLISQMEKLGVEPSTSTYDGFIRAVVKVRGFRDGLEMIKVMQERNLRPRDSTLGTISISCSKELELDLAESFLYQISLYPVAYPYNHFLEACDILDQPERAVRVLAKMRHMDVQPNVRTYELLFSLFGNVNAPYEDGNILSQLDAAKRISAIEADMTKNGIQHSYVSLRNLLRAFGKEGMIKELIQYLRVAEYQFSSNKTMLSTPIYNAVLHSLVEAKESQLAIEIFKTMIACGYQPDAATYTIMIDCCSIFGGFNSASALVALMIREGFNPLGTTCTALIKVLLKLDDIDGALNILKKGCSEEIAHDVHLFNAILRAAADKGRLDIVEFLVERMHRKKIHPDPSTCSSVFSAYVKQRYFSTALEALQVLSLRMILGDDNNFENTRSASYEDNIILAEDLDAESRIIELFKESKENIAVGLLNIRWCAILGYPLSWFPDQSPWAKSLSNSYGSRIGE